eukprot:375053-Rhodomonas_salina.1
MPVLAMAIDMARIKGRAEREQGSQQDKAGTSHAIRSLLDIERGPGAYFAVRYTVLGGLGDLEGEEVIALGACASAL